MERKGSTVCLTYAPTEGPWPAKGKKREAESPFPGGPALLFRGTAAGTLAAPVSLLNVAFPLPWCGFSFPERRRSRRCSL